LVFFLLKLLLVFAKNLIITSVFEKNAIFSPKIDKNRRKLWSYVTSTLGRKADSRWAPLHRSRAEDKILYYIYDGDVISIYWPSWFGGPSPMSISPVGFCVFDQEPILRFLN
jgi:hypothetical protein